MIAFNDSERSVDEPKTARMEQRTKPHVKAAIQEAAALMGVDETAFVTSAAYERALVTISAHERTVLSAEDREAFFAALENPSVPTEVLRDMFDLHDRLLDDGE